MLTLDHHGGSSACVALCHREGGEGGREKGRGRGEWRGL